MCPRSRSQGGAGRAGRDLASSKSPGAPKWVREDQNVQREKIIQKFIRKRCLYFICKGRVQEQKLRL